MGDQPLRRLHVVLGGRGGTGVQRHLVSGVSLRLQLDQAPRGRVRLLRRLDRRKIAWTPAEIEADKARLKPEIRQAISSTLWGLEEGYKVTIEIDRQVQRAIDLFPEARQLAAIPAGATVTNE